MDIVSTLYNWLPEPWKPIARRWYYTLYGRSQTSSRDQFISHFFSSSAEYHAYVEEYEEGPVSEIRNKGVERYRQLTGDDGLGSIPIVSGQDIYALVRALEPTIVVETGVCNGLSTLCILLAMRENGSGELYSIDYPYRADEPLDEFREDTFEGYGGAAIPSDKEPGWIVPEGLRDRWRLIIGKSQRELPILATELDRIDVFLHDSEHSHPCMMFEYELAWEWLDDNGVILSDDITWNDAFSIFVDVREPQWGTLSENFGYMRKREGGM